MSKKFIGRCLLVVAIMCGVAAVPALGLSLYVGYYMMVPRYSALATFEPYGFNLRLDLYLTDDEARDSGRYLSVINGGAYHTFMLSGWDWSHRARTSLYRIDENHIAVLSPMGTDDKITLKPFAVEPAVSQGSEQWQYLGAFDFIFPPGERPRLEFFEHLAECIPMTTDKAAWTAEPRASARSTRCPNPPPQ